MHKIWTKLLIGFLSQKHVAKFIKNSSPSLTFICWGVFARQTASKLKMLIYLPLKNVLRISFVWGSLGTDVILTYLHHWLLFWLRNIYVLLWYCSNNGTNNWVVLHIDMFWNKWEGVGEGKLEATAAYRFGTERFFKIASWLLPFSLK